MALGDDYLTTADLKEWMSITGTADDTLIDTAVSAASRGVETFCRRQFNQTAAASPRRYVADDAGLLWVDDFHTTTDLEIATDNDGDGTFETVWGSGDYQLEPLDGVVGGVDGWPFRAIRAVGTHRFPCGDRAGVRVTARWGWAAVPDAVAQATKIVAAEIFKLKDAPLGVAGFGDFGVVRVRSNPVAAAKLAPYVADPVLVA